jgi:hypothetical protein
VCEYDLSRLHNLRLDSSDRGNSVRIRFDYDGRSAGIGDWMPRSQAESLIESITTSARENAAKPFARNEADSTRTRPASELSPSNCHLRAYADLILQI